MAGRGVQTDPSDGQRLGSVSLHPAPPVEVQTLLRSTVVHAKARTLCHRLPGGEDKLSLYRGEGDVKGGCVIPSHVLSLLGRLGEAHRKHQWGVLAPAGGSLFLVWPGVWEG